MVSSLRPLLHRFIQAVHNQERQSWQKNIATTIWARVIRKALTPHEKSIKPTKAICRQSLNHQLPRSSLWVKMSRKYSCIGNVQHQFILTFYDNFLNTWNSVSTVTFFSFGSKIQKDIFNLKISRKAKKSSKYVYFTMWKKNLVKLTWFGAI